jgi:uncharacterized protein (DUF362 family)/ferredoxin
MNGQITAGVTDALKQHVRVGLARVCGYDPAVVLEGMRRCLEPFGGMRAVVQPGQRVLLKPNLLGGFHPERAVTTHPAVVRAAIILVQEAGGIPLVGDSPAMGDLASVLGACRLAPVLAETGAQPLDCSEPREFEGAENRLVRRLVLTRALENVDVVISLPKLKTHGQMTLTAALKNQYGLIPGALKSQWHFRLQEADWLAALILDIHRLVRPRLAILDAVVAMEGAGPTSGTPRPLGTLLAGTDFAAVDCVACQLIGQDPSRVPLLRVAAQQGLGETNLERIDILGDDWRSLTVEDFKRVERPVDVMRLLPLPAPMLRWIQKHWTLQPRIVEGRCTRCGICEDGCPVKPSAIHPLAEPGLKVEDSRCIHCYCCHEFCPSHGIELRKPWLTRHLRLTRMADGASRLVGWLSGSGGKR